MDDPVELAADEKSTLTILLQQWIKENRSRRRWSIFFRLIYVLLGLMMFLIMLGVVSTAGRGHTMGESRLPHAAIIDVEGMISSQSYANADDITRALMTAFKNTKVRGVIVKVNSPGGSPVESAIVFDEIMRLRHKFPKKKVYAVCADVCASGAYFIAAAADEIYANPMSLVGSIGVRLDSFGFVGAMEKMGIERRLFTAGENKAILDPFTPVNPKGKAHVERLLKSTHQDFINSVKKGRGDRLKKNPDLFTGLFWSGRQALDLGLIDGFGNANQVAREKLKVKHTVDYTIQPSPFDRLAGRMGVSLGGG